MSLKLEPTCWYTDILAGGLFVAFHGIPIFVGSSLVAWIGTGRIGVSCIAAGACTKRIVHAFKPPRPGFLPQVRGVEADRARREGVPSSLAQGCPGKFEVNQFVAPHVPPNIGVSAHSATTWRQRSHFCAEEPSQCVFPC